MPIYVYRCAECGFTQDILQKIADPERTVCPACNQAQFKKQVTAAGFQLKGSGWYVTDFRNANNAPETSKNGATQSDSNSGSNSDSNSVSNANSGSDSTTHVPAVPSTQGATHSESNSSV